MTDDTSPVTPRAVVLIPAGPRDDVADTVRSALAYVARPRLVVVVDDTGDPGCGPALSRLDRDVVVLPAAPSPGAWGGLWVKLARALQWVCEHVTFDVVLRMDADALVVGPQPEADARRVFGNRPDLGLLGSHRVDCNGDPRDFGPAADCLRFEAGLAGCLWRPRRARTLRRVLPRALAHGYVAGEHCQGGAYFFSAACVLALRDAGLLELPVLGSSNLGEDQLFALLARAVGFDIGDFATGELPLGVRWRGLPGSPPHLADRGKKVVHSVRSWDSWTEGEIREWFRTTRQGWTNGHPGAAPLPSAL